MLSNKNLYLQINTSLYRHIKYLSLKAIKNKEFVGKKIQIWCQNGGQIPFFRKKHTKTPLKRRKTEKKQGYLNAYDISERVLLIGTINC